MKTRILLLAVCIFFVLFGFGNLSLAFRTPDRPMLPDFDKRLPAQPQALDPQRQAAADALRTRIPTVRVGLDELLGSPRWILNTQGFLTGPDFPDAPPLPPIPGRNPPLLLSVQAALRDQNRAVRNFLDQNVNLFG